MSVFNRRMAQPGSALPWGGRGRGFKSRYADSMFSPHSSILSFSFQAASNCRERLEYEADGAPNVGVNFKTGVS